MYILVVHTLGLNGLTSSFKKYCIFAVSQSQSHLYNMYNGDIGYTNTFSANTSRSRSLCSLAAVLCRQMNN